jgi:hypothetical protein
MLFLYLLPIFPQVSQAPDSGQDQSASL